MKVSIDDFAVAPNLMVTAVFIFLIKMSIMASLIKGNPSLTSQYIDNLVWRGLVFGLLLVGMTALSWILREKGWIKDKYVGFYKLKPTAIVISDVVGALYIIIAYNF